MPMKTELVFVYDGMMRPTSAKCRLCGEVMPKPGIELSSSADIVLWLSERFLEHKKLRHSEHCEDWARKFPRIAN